MKRFYCPRCYRIIRARSLPKDAFDGDDGFGKVIKVGTCKHHHSKEKPHDQRRSR